MAPAGEGSFVVQRPIVGLVDNVEVAKRIQRDARGIAQAVRAQAAYVAGVGAAVAAIGGEAAILAEDQVGGGIARIVRRSGMRPTGEGSEVFQHPAGRLIGDVEIVRSVKRDAPGSAQAVGAYAAVVAGIRGEEATLPEDHVGSGIARIARRPRMAPTSVDSENVCSRVRSIPRPP